MKAGAAAGALCLALLLAALPEARAAGREGGLEAFLLTFENDFLYETDMYYTSGLQLLFSFSAAEPFSRAERRPAPEARGAGERGERLSFGFGQSMYTPRHIKTTAPQEQDRPYVGYLYFFLSKTDNKGSVEDSSGLTFGWSGPAALAKEVQGGIHRLTGNVEAQGWDSQLSGAPMLMLGWRRVLRLRTAWPVQTVRPVQARADGLDWELLPRFALSLGTPLTGASVGLELRAGLNPGADASPPRLLYVAQSGPGKDQGLSLYAFAGAEGSFALHDSFVDGHLFRAGLDIEKRPWRYNLYAGLGLRARGLCLKATQHLLSREFREQEKEQSFLSLSLGYLF